MRIKMSKMKEMTDNKKKNVIIGKKNNQKSFPALSVYPWVGISLSASETDGSRKENPQKLTQLSSRSHPRHLVGKRTAQKDTIIDTTSDSQGNSNFPNRWSPASLTFNSNSL